ncbi:MAG: ATP synthase subunit a [Candidatus Poribacteria bacterium]|nr:MAG: ATP synthase subunit a [Candidatus Poribacteria bacterium]
MTRRIRAVLVGGWSLLSLPALAAEEVHNSFLAVLLPRPIKEWLYQREGWGQLDVIPNTIFIGLILLIGLGWMARRLERIPQRRSQNFLEWLIGGLNNTFGPVLGERGRKYLPFVNSFFLFILAWNLSGFIPGFQAPTAELNTTLALALVSITTVQIIAIRELGLIGYLAHLWGRPLWLGVLMFPVEVITQLSRVLSLSLRLFANIFAKEMVLGVLCVLAIQVFYIPVQLPVLFIGLLASLIQAFIFAILTAVYIDQFIGHHSEEHGVHEAMAH